MQSGPTSARPSSHGDPHERALRVAGRLIDVYRSERALEVLASAPAANPLTWALRAAASLNLDRNEEAIAAARETMNLAGPTAVMLDIICVANLRLARPREALAAIERARALEPGDALLTMHHAGALAALPETREAGRQLAAEAFAMAPTDARVVQARLEIAAALGDHDQAGESAERLLALEAENPVAHLSLAVRQALAGDPERAKRHLALGVRADARSPLFPRAAAYVWTAAHPLAWMERARHRLGHRRFIGLAVGLSLGGGASAGSLAAVSRPVGAVLTWIGAWVLIGALLSSLAVPLLRRRRERQLRRRPDGAR